LHVTGQQRGELGADRLRLGLSTDDVGVGALLLHQALDVTVSEGQLAACLRRLLVGHAVPRSKQEYERGEGRQDGAPDPAVAPRVDDLDGQQVHCDGRYPQRVVGFVRGWFPGSDAMSSAARPAAAVGSAPVSALMSVVIARLPA